MTRPAVPTADYDALLIVSFGGPERREDVLPFLENVVRGKPVPRERLLEVAEHYYHFGGKSPINDQCREFIAALKDELHAANITLPVYWGNRNWHPLLTDTIAQMSRDGVRRALAFVMSAYSSYSGCRQYLENIAAAQTAVGDDAPVIDKVRAFYNHPEFIAANAERIEEALAKPGFSESRASKSSDLEARLSEKPGFLLFTAHSIPVSMAEHCDYVKQLTETSRLVADAIGWPTDRWRLAYQSRSGRPSDPWLEPDITEALRELARQKVQRVVVAPIGFLSDHLEVLYDLDYEAQRVAKQLGMTMIRAGTVGAHPRFVSMARELIEERLGRRTERRALGTFGPRADECTADCCVVPNRHPKS